MNSLGRAWLTNGSLALVALILTGIVVLRGAAVTTEEVEARPSALLGAFRREDVTRIVVEWRRPQPRRVMLERLKDETGQDAWTLREPFREPADPQRVAELLDALDSATILRRMNTKPSDREVFGFVTPRAVLRLDMGHVGYRVLLGKPAAAPHDAVFLEVTGHDAPRAGVVAVRSQLADKLFVSPDELRPRSLMPYGPADLKQLALQGAGGPRVLVRGEWGGWRFASQYDGARLARASVERLLSQLPRLEAIELLDPAVAEQSLGTEPVVRIEAVPSDARLSAVIMRVGGRCPSGDGAVALRERPDRRAGCIPASVLAGLLTPAEALVDEALFSLVPEEVERVDMAFGRNGQTRLELARRGTEFELVAPKQRNVPTEAAEQLLARLTRARAKLVDRRSASHARFMDPRGRVTMTPTDPRQEAQVLIVGRAGQDGRIFVLRKQDRAVLQIDRNTAELLEPNLKLLRPHELFTWTQDQIREVDLDVLGVRQRIRSSERGKAELIYPPGFRADAGAISELFRTLSKLRVLRWVSSRDKEVLGLATPVGQVRILVELNSSETAAAPDKARATQGHRALVLSLGATAPGGRYARLNDGSGAFVLPKSALSTLERLVIDRSPFITPPADVLRVSVQHEGRTVTLVSQGDTLVESSGGALLGDTDLRDITEALASLRAEAAVRVGPPLPHEGLRDPLLSVRVTWRDGKQLGRPRHWSIGAADAWQGTAVYYARADGINATFAIARPRLERLFELL